VEAGLEKFGLGGVEGLVGVVRLGGFDFDVDDLVVGVDALDVKRCQLVVFRDPDDEVRVLSRSA
jgi:hypothetical protein